MMPPSPSHHHTPSLAAEIAPAEIERRAGALALRLAELTTSQPDATRLANDLAHLLHNELGAAEVVLFTCRATSKSAKARSASDRLTFAASHPARENIHEGILRTTARHAWHEHRLIESPATAEADAPSSSDLRIAALPLGAPAVTCVVALCWEANGKQANAGPLPILIRLAPALALATQPLRASLPARTPARTATTPPPPRGERAGGRGPAKTATSLTSQMGLLALMSHELRTPLNTINGFLEILLDGLAGPLSERQREFLSYAHTSTRRLTQLLEEMVLLSRSAQSRGLLYRAPTNLQSVLASARAAHAETASARGVLLAYEIAGALPTIHADEARLAQALAYLLGWALARTPSGGTVTLRASRDVEGVTIMIEDSGPPLARAALARLFAPFRPSPEIATAPATTGLELAVAHRLITLHGGELRASQRPEGGMRLLVTLPSATETAAPASAS